MTPKDLMRRQSSTESVCKVGAQSGRLRESAACLVGSFSSVCRSVHQLLSSLRCGRSVSGHHRVDLDRSCKVRAADGCLHLAELSLWNNFMRVIMIELREAWLALNCLRGRVDPLVSNEQRRRSFVLVHWPLVEHRSTEFLELCESRMPPKQFLLRDGLVLSDNLRHARLCYHLPVYPSRDPMDALRSTVTTLDTLEIVSVRFSSVGVSCASWSTGATPCAHSHSSKTGSACPWR
ncbi:uncharacterized protein [Dermacentor albipictus]|uniref:uncharacterized protein n=1 Tax=Dermacentor albipictus TaxID=60249 RepID=UPI0031FE25DC